ncbi:MAG: recombination regulator RecX [Lachnospiraceae bacterium]|nr:recombination regulator RecX [Lachnospiraceae bacterium]
MTVTGIEEAGKKKVRIFIDDEFAFVLYKGELRRYRISEGSEIGEGEYSEIMQEVLPRRAKLRSMNLLKARPYTEKQLRDKLRQGEYADSLIEEAIEYVKSYGYIDDRRYAEDYISYYAQYRSRRRIEQELLYKGIERDITQEIFEQREEEGEGPDELAMAKKLLRKKNYDPHTAQIREKQKLSAFLYRKGFTSDTIRRALSLDITPD